MNPLSLFLASEQESLQPPEESGDAVQPLAALKSTQEANRGIFGSRLSSFKG